MGIEKFIAGAIIGAFVTNPANQKLITNLAIKSAAALTDMLNKNGGVVNDTESKES